MGMISNIRLWEDNPNRINKVDLVRVEFTCPVNWAVFSIEELKEILRLWIIGEEKVYPQSKGFKGRWLLFEEIKRVFNET